MENTSRKIIGCMAGTAVGDALGLPCEGLSRNRQKRIFGTVDSHRLFLGRGMTSDDTDHTCMVAQALIASGGDPNDFGRDLARSLRLWLLTVPPGIGKATLFGMLKLWMGAKPDASGVFSAGNGPAMRSGLLGVCYGDNPEWLREWVRVSTRITHTDLKAEWGALAVAVAASLSSTSETAPDPEMFHERLQSDLPTDVSQEFRDLMDRTCAAAQSEMSLDAFAESLGLGRGVTGYIYHTVPVVLFAWLRNPDDYRKAVLSVIHCGGDTDTTAAIVGAIVGARVGIEGIPAEWKQGMANGPLSLPWIEHLGERLSISLQKGPPQKSPSLSLFTLWMRNICLLGIVLFHGFRRLFPPY